MNATWERGYDQGYRDGAKQGQIPLWATLAILVIGLSAGVIGGFLLAHL